MLFNKVLKVDIVGGGKYLGTALVAKLALNLGHLVLNYLVDLLRIGKNCLELNDKSVKSAKLILYLIALHARKLTECHFNDSLRLNLT